MNEDSRTQAGRRAGAALSTVALTALALLSQLPAGLSAQVPGRLRGEIKLEGRAFPEAPADPRQQEIGTSVALEVEYDVDWNGGDQILVVEPFFRYDPFDSQRTHFDFHVLSWTLVRDVWELRLGYRTVFWGVAESQHLVDIINQTDLVEDPDGEDKLGQPMVNFALIQDWGTLELFLMPFFRERTFPGIDGRLRFHPPIDPDLADFESGAGRQNLDWAVRWFHTLGAWDIGLSHFAGTSRDPSFRPRARGETAVLAPFYDQINQTGLDLQMTGEAWLWKLEAITRGGQGDRYFAFTGGFERTLVGVLGSNADLGLLAEYLFDSRGTSPASTSPFQNDLFVGTRLALNDVQSSELLAGAIIDLGTAALALNLEGSRRLGDDWTVEVNARAFLNVSKSEPLAAFRRDGYFELGLVRHF